ncbi:MAG TPA: YraN family protein, partial [Marmoricola sp.]|nr:YraN family protein [Marmoricola sp.]
DTLVVCEVKTRRSERFGHPLESVTAAKAERLRGLTELWMHTRGLRPPQVRIDIVGVLLDGPGAGRVSHLRGVG